MGYSTRGGTEQLPALPAACHWPHTSTAKGPLLPSPHPALPWGSSAHTDASGSSTARLPADEWAPSEQSQVRAVLLLPYSCPRVAQVMLGVTGSTGLWWSVGSRFIANGLAFVWGGNNNRGVWGSLSSGGVQEGILCRFVWCVSSLEQWSNSKAINMDCWKSCDGGDQLMFRGIRNLLTFHLIFYEI